MAKIVLALLLSTLLWANIFDRKCEACHRRLHKPLKKIFFNYLLYHSSERRVIKAMKQNILHPDKKHNISKNLYKHSIKPNELDILLQIYWNRYKVIGKIK